MIESFESQFVRCSGEGSLIRGATFNFPSLAPSFHNLIARSNSSSMAFLVFDSLMKSCSNPFLIWVIALVRRTFVFLSWNDEFIPNLSTMISSPTGIVRLVKLRPLTSSARSSSRVYVFDSILWFDTGVYLILYFPPSCVPEFNPLLKIFSSRERVWREGGATDGGSEQSLLRLDRWR